MTMLFVPECFSMTAKGTRVEIEQASPEDQRQGRTFPTECAATAVTAFGCGLSASTFWDEAAAEHFLET